MFKFSRSWMPLVLVAAVFSAPLHGAGADGKSLELRFLLQPWLQLTEAGAPDGQSAGKEFFLKRARIILSGKITPKIAFFAETDIPEWGKGSDWSSRWILQDAYVDFTLIEGKGYLDRLNLACGLILLPFSHHNRQSAASLNTLNYHGELLRFPPSSHKAWRDTGVEARALLLGKRLDVRLGIFNGSRGVVEGGHEVNPRDLPRWTGRVQFNLLDPEEGFFYGGNYLGERSVCSFGLGMDFQPDAFPAGGAGAASVDFLGLAADLFVDYPLAPNRELIFQAGYYIYRHGGEEISLPAYRPASGRALGLEAGFRVGRLEPVLSYERFDPDAAGETAFFRNLRLGLNWWISGHACNLKAEYALIKTRDRDPETRGVLTAQLQLLY